MIHMGVSVHVEGMRHMHFFICERNLTVHVGNLAPLSVPRELQSFGFRGFKAGLDFLPSFYHYLHCFSYH